MVSKNEWTIRELLNWISNYLFEKLDDVDESHAKMWAQMLISHVSGMSKIQLYMSLDETLNSQELQKLRECVYECGSGKPIQYVLGEAPFRYLTLKVAPGVLIPRPETEVLVSEVLKLLPNASKRVARDSMIAESDGAQVIELQAQQHLLTNDSDEKIDLSSFYALSNNREEISSAGKCSQEKLLVADLCTGSGCIACALATERDDLQVIATDISPVAVKLAKVNILKSSASARAQVLQGNLGDPIEKQMPHLMGEFDAIVSNPPYVPTSCLEHLPANVSNFEPTLALDGGEDGLDLFREILTWTFHALKAGGALAVELHETCLDEAAQLARKAGFCNVRIIHDLADKPRVLICIKPNGSCALN